MPTSTCTPIRPNSATNSARRGWEARRTAHTAPATTSTARKKVSQFGGWKGWRNEPRTHGPVTENSPAKAFTAPLRPT
jgi:hypothetical protein